MRWVLLLLIAVAPTSSFASVTISEIAWMGTTQDPNGSYCEWIELFNSENAPVSLDGWTLSFGNASIVFGPESFILGSDYFVVERYTENACPDPVQNISDFSTSFGAGISNAGATLKLVRPDSGLEDQFSSNDAWEKQGDNVTKETAQYTTTGWVTAAPTPGQGLTDYTPPVEDEAQAPAGESPVSITKASTKNKIVSLELPNVSLSLAINSPDIVYVNQPVTFKVSASGLGKTILESLTYEWNFGDISTSESKETSHTYTSPGEFVVAAYATFVRHEQVARKTITVLPVAFSLAKNSAGDILIHNNAKYEVNISNYKIVGNLGIVFPKRSIILPNATLTIPKESLLTNSFTSVTLYDQKRVAVASTQQEVFVPVAVPQKSVALASPKMSVSENVQKEAPPSGNFSFSGDVKEGSGTSASVSTTAPAKVDTGVAQKASVIEANSGIPSGALPYLGLFGILSLGILAAFAGKKQ